MTVLLTSWRFWAKTFCLFGPVCLEFLGVVAAETNEPQSKFLRFKEAVAVKFGLSKFTPRLQRSVVVFQTLDKTWTPETFLTPYLSNADTYRRFDPFYVLTEVTDDGRCIFSRFLKTLKHIVS